MPMIEFGKLTENAWKIIRTDKDEWEKNRIIHKGDIVEFVFLSEAGWFSGDLPKTGTRGRVIEARMYENGNGFVDVEWFDGTPTNTFRMCDVRKVESEEVEA